MSSTIFTHGHKINSFIPEQIENNIIQRSHVRRNINSDIGIGDFLQDFLSLLFKPVTTTPNLRFLYLNDRNKTTYDAGLQKR
ncbi:MAG TPA: hypothetical protein VNJ08_00745 [Bacteriovoracaceae bacterium]|nr:hypothetical protein [Bacteriovoracaceae bacterium]